MSSRGLVAGLPLVAESALILMVVLNLVFSEGFFMLEWMGAFLVFYGLSYLVGTRPTLPIAGAVLVAGSLGDIILLGGDARELDHGQIHGLRARHPRLPRGEHPQARSR